MKAPKPLTVEPPAAVAILCELLGRCPRCSAPIEPTPDGWLALTHAIGCALAEDTRRGAA